MTKSIYLWVLIILSGAGIIKSQSPATYVFPSPTPNPPNLTVNTYSRATTSIKMQNGFKYGFNSAAATNLLNLNLSSYPSYVNNNYHNPAGNANFYAVNPSLEAAVTPGFSDVSSTGGFSYDVPIVCSPGTAGMEPKLSITYNSNAGNNCLGLGFNLTGISMISRGGKSLFYDGVKTGINFNSGDVFNLDGSRLLIKSGTYGQSGATYKTEVENYYTITSVGSQGNGPQSFTVTTPDGLTMEYGTVPSAKCLDVSNTEVLAWYINKMYDVFGNYMEYSYTNTGGEILINKISYTGNSVGSIAPYNKIEFDYETRSDENSYYMNGKEFKRSHILKHIVCKDVNNAIVRKYCFDYQYEFASLLNKITEVDANGNALNPTFFQWRNEGLSSQAAPLVTPFTLGIPNTSSPIYSKVLPVDFNGDGWKDVLALTLAGTFTAQAQFSQKNIGGFTPIAQAINFGSNNVLYINSNTFDEDDDDKEELFITYLAGTAYYVKKVKYVNGSFVVSTEQTDTVPSSGSGAWHYPHIRATLYNESRYFYAKEDVTGDNVRDKIFVDEFKLVVNPSGGSPITINTTNTLKTGLGDFDGDGILDIYTVKGINPTSPPYLCEVYRYDASTNSLALTSTITINTGINYNLVINSDPIVNNYARGGKAIDFGDFNGDGKTDIMYINYIGGAAAKAYVLKSNGIAFLNDPNPISISSQVGGYEAGFLAMDVNNDGYCDLAAVSDDGIAHQTNFDHYPSNGNFLTPAVGSHSYPDNILGVFGDFNGDGSMDYLTQTGWVGLQWNLNCFNQNNKKQVQRIFNLKNDIQIDYVYLPGESILKNHLGFVSRFDYYTASSPLNTDPAFKIMKPDMFVVRSLIINDRNTRYRYSNGVFHIQGKGFLGFEKVYQSHHNDMVNIPGNVTMYTYSSLYDDATMIETTDACFSGVFTINTAKISGNRQSLYNFVQTGSNRYINSTTTTSKNYLSSTYHVLTKTFDNAHGGNLLSSSSSYLKWTNLQTINDLQTNYTYQSLINPIPGNGSTYYRTLQVTEARVANGSPTSNYTHDFNYNASTGHLTGNVENSNISGSAITTAYSQFNTYGQALNVSITAPDLSLPKTSSVQFDATGRFVTQATDVLGNSTQAIYEPGNGNVIQSTDITGLVTKYEYDGLGRPVKITSSTGAVNTSKYEWYLVPTPSWVGTSSNTYYGLKITNTYEANGSKTSYFDRDNNEVRTETSGFAGNTIVCKATYDFRNRLHTKTEDHFTNQNQFKTTYMGYDDFDRPASISEQLGSTVLYTINYSYNSLSSNSSYNKGYVKVEKPSGNGTGSIYTIQENNEAGQTDKIINYENVNAQQSVSYTFNQHGLPTQAVTNFPGGQGIATTTFGYDALARKNTMTDPSAGTYNYGYNSIGQVTTEAGPNGQYSYVYDIAGRLQTKTGSSQGTYNYFYFTSGNGLSKLKKITGPEVTTEFSYDAFNRLIEKKETMGSGANSKVFKTNFSFDKYNRLVDQIYPGNFKTTNEYDANGVWYKIKNNNTPIWELTGMFTPNRIQTYKNSAGITTQITYDNSLNLQQIDLGSLHSQFYNINSSTSNVMSRAQQNFATNSDNNEGFEYDDFNRLKQTNYVDATATTIIKHLYSYNANGNFSHKDDCGDYVYGNTASPYQVTLIQNAANNFNLNTLNVTSNDLDKVSQITEANTSRNFAFVYGNDDERVKMEYKVLNQLQYTRYYQSNYDREETSSAFREWSYIHSPAGLTAVYYNNNGATQLLDVTNDHLNSPILLTNQNGQVVEEQSFDAWGRRRNPADWSYSNVSTPQIMIRGYTGHEHLDEVGLINMNGRVYDPVLGRFIQPDPLIQAPENIQNYNRYSYVLNNPLKYTDPSGYAFGYHSVYSGSGTSFMESQGMNSSFEMINTSTPGETSSPNVDVSFLIGGGNPNPAGGGSGGGAGDILGNIASSAPRVNMRLNDVRNEILPRSTNKLLINKENNNTLVSKFDDLVITPREVTLEDVFTANELEIQSGGGSVFSYAVPIALAAAAADGPIPIGDIVGAVILAGATAYDATQRTFVTYTMRNAAGQVYVGRTSGYGDAYSIMMNRASGHHMKTLGYGNPILDRAVQGYEGYPAIRGREQQLIDSYGGVGSPGVGNSIRGVSPYNPAYPIYHGASNLYFGPLAPYTGF